MDKTTIINQLRNAKSAHIKWRTYAQALVSGIEMDEDKVPILHTNCAFGKWYYGSGQVLKDLPSYQAIELPHEMMHKQYLKLFKHLFEEEDVSLFKRLIGRTKSSKKNDETTKALLDDIINMSKTLLEAIAILEEDIIKMSDQEAAAIV